MKLTESESDEVRNALAEVVDQVGKYFVHHVAGGIGSLPEDPDRWGLVHLRATDVIQQLLVARRALKDVKYPKLIECGSGIGLVACLAKELGFSVKGVEYFAEYVVLGRKIFPTVEVQKGDIMDQDFSTYDAIYYYLPFQNEEMQAAFELKVEAEAKTGAVVLANRKVSSKWRASGAWEKIWEDDPFTIVLKKGEPVT